MCEPTRMWERTNCMGWVSRNLTVDIALCSCVCAFIVESCIV